MALLLSSFLLLTAFHSGCKKPTEPPNGGGPDTTSHDFQFQTFVLGDGNASVLYDVQVIADDDIWAVGEVFFRDSAGQYSERAYNVVRWDGTRWSYQRLSFPQYNVDCSIAFHLPGVTFAVFAFASNNVLISDGGSIARWNGSSFVHYPCLSHSLRNGTIRRIWGTSENQFYVVGEEGTVIRYNNGEWQKLESGTTLHVLDVWGSTLNGETEILAVASNSVSTFDRRILRITGSSIEAVSDRGIEWPLAGVWFAKNKKYYVVGSGIYWKNLLSDSSWTDAPLELTEYGSSDVSANDSNDVVVVGAFGDFLHYNGATWKQYPELLMNGSFHRVAIRNNTVAAVGHIGNRAIAVIGRRQ